MMTITNDNGRKFTVKIVRKGGRYGAKKCLTHNEAEPLVEFYDATYAGDKDFDPEGQFVSRYNASTLRSIDRNRVQLGCYGLDLMGYEPAWKIDAKTMTVVYAWLENELRNEIPQPKVPNVFSAPRNC